MTMMMLLLMIHKWQVPQRRECILRTKEASYAKVTVNLQGVPVEGIVDSGADITIINGEVFKKVAASLEEGF